MPWKTALYGELGNTLFGGRWGGGVGEGVILHLCIVGGGARVWWSSNITFFLTNSCWMMKSLFPLLPLLPSILILPSGVQKSAEKLLQHWEDKQLSHPQLMPCHMLKILFPGNVGPPGSIGLWLGKKEGSRFTWACCRHRRTERSTQHLVEGMSGVPSSAAYPHMISSYSNYRLVPYLMGVDSS